MKRFSTIAALLVFLVPCFHLYAAEKQYADGRIVAVEKKFHDRVLYYQGNTPIIQEDPYYEITLRLGDLMLLTEFTPRHADDDLPDGLTESAKVQIKVADKHHVWVKREGGMELQLLLVKRLPSTETEADPEPVPAKK